MLRCHPNRLLSANSPCIDAGSADGAPSRDIEGQARWDHPGRSNAVSTVDIGVYEYVDSDEDGLSDWYEQSCGSDPLDADTDVDGLDDGAEVLTHGSDPLSPDTDADGLGDGAEIAHGFDPRDHDSDADGVGDAVEALAVLWPSDPDSETPASVTGTFGDYGIGERQSERYILYMLAIGETNPAAALATWLNPTTNVSTEYEADIPLGEARSFNLRWWSHTNDSRNVVCDQDYRWHMSGVTNNALGWYWTTRRAVDQTITNGVVYSPFTNATVCTEMTDRGHLEVHYVDKVTQDMDFGGGLGAPVANAAPGKRVDVYVPLVDLDNDVNRDGSMDAADALIESVGLGAVVLLNGDDDNTNGMPDSSEVESQVSGENDLHLVRFTRGPESMPTGTVQLAIVSGAGSIRVWLSPEKGASNLLLSASNPSTNWVLTCVSSWAEIPTNLWVEAVSNSASAGDCILAARFLSPDGNALCADTNVFTAFRIGLTPDYDRDGKIDDTDRMLVSMGEPFRFWVNDDNDDGYEDGSDVPGEGRPDWRDSMWGVCLGTYRVDGVRDFVDFFPVLVDLKAALDVLGTDGYRYYLRHRTEAVNALMTASLSADEADFHLFSTNFCLPNASSELVPITSAGKRLRTSLLSAIRDDGKGVILLEGRSASTNSLILEVRRTGEGVVFSTELTVSLSPVNDMFRCLNLRDVAEDPPVGWTTATGVPLNYPDALCTDTNLIFVHGWTADFGDPPATGWVAEVFKRFHASGSRARFHSVLWCGNQGRQMNFQHNVNNAFLTASNLAVYVNGLSGPSVIAAHSLGNVVVSSAIADHEMSVDKYFLLDAAVPAEAYDSSVDLDPRMVHSQWTEYTNACWAANWYRLFDDTNTRSRLKWKNRFSNVLTNTTAYSFYSAGDEVFELGTITSVLSGIFGTYWFKPWTWTTERYSWQKQELFKGTRYLWLPGLNYSGGTTFAGWGFNTTWVDEEPDGAGQHHLVPAYTPAAAAAAVLEEPSPLITNAVFRLTPEGLVGTSDLSDAEINEMLAKGIPSLTPSAGNTAMAVFAGDEGAPLQFNMNIGGDGADSFKPNGWPRPYVEPYFDQWLHNDVRVMAYLYTYRAYTKIVETGGL